MKLTITLLLFAILTATAGSTYSQSTRINLKMKNASLVDVFREIERTSEFGFFFKSEELDLNKHVSIDLKDATIDEILEKILIDNYSYRILDKNIIVTRSSTNTNVSEQQQKTVSGKVIDNTGASLPGVSVVVKGTTTGVITDMDGKYTLAKVPENATLQFSFVGMKMQQIEVKGKTTVDVTLSEETVGIEEVVAVGYGSMRKKDLTGTISRANIDAFKESPNVSIMQSLQGTVAGLNVGQTTKAGEEPSIEIRGKTTISGSTSPLIVLDGIIFRGNIIDINSHDVESIDILKDASAAAIYGSQASNGVMMITTKKGKDLGKPVISYSGSYSYQLPSNKDLYPNDANGFIKRIEDTYLTDSRLGPDYMQKNPNFNPLSHLMTPSAIAGYNDGVNNNWWNLLTNDHGSIQDQNISVTGKSALSDYYFSVGYTDQQNLIVNDTYKKYSIRINLENKITDWMKLGIQSFLTSSDYSGVSPTMSTVTGMPPVVAAYDSSGEAIREPYKNGLNPLLEIKIDDLDKRLNLSGNFYADINVPFIKGLNYRLNFSQNLRSSRKNSFNPYGNNYQGVGYKFNSYEYDWTLDHILTYKKSFGKHTINGTFVYGREKRIYDDSQANATIFSNMALGYNSLESGKADQQSVSSGAWDENSLYAMTRLFYSYNDRYLFTGTVRRDGFSGFGENNKFGIFPSLALGWVLSEESFMKDRVKWINNIKVRLSYGSSGNRTVGRYQTLAKLGTAARYLYGDGGSAELAQWKTSMANSDLKWEETSTFNGGLDFALLNSRLSGSFDYYKGKTSNLLYNIDIPMMNGLGSVPVNIGEIQNSGQELTLNGIIVKKKDFSWQTTFNFSRNRNKVISINGKDNNKDGKEDDILAGGKGNSIMIGKPYGIWYDYQIVGMYQLSDVGNIPAGFDFGTYKVSDLNKDGLYTAANDRMLLGYKDPSYRFSIMNTFSYKNFSLSIFINSIQGGKNYYLGDSSPTGSYSNTDNVYQNNGPMWDYWMPENPTAKYRRLGTFPKSLGYEVAPLTQRNFVRLQDVSLSYNFQNNFLRQLKIRSLKLYVSGKNLATWTKWDGWDPETGVGIVEGGSPVMKSYTFGLNVEF